MAVEAVEDIATCLPVCLLIYLRMKPLKILPTPTELHMMMRRASMKMRRRKNRLRMRMKKWRKRRTKMRMRHDCCVPFLYVNFFLFHDELGWMILHLVG